MNNNKDQNNACYQLDYFEFDGKNYPSLTKKNRDFIEAILSIDSNYRQYKIIQFIIIFTKLQQTRLVKFLKD